jgi:hypothetical protein
VTSFKQSYGLSKVAGTTALAQAAVTRCVLVPISCLLLPPVFISVSRSLRLIPSSLSSRSLILIELGTIYASLQAALPASLAIFPQVQTFLLGWIGEEKPFYYGFEL